MRSAAPVPPGGAITNLAATVVLCLASAIAYAGGAVLQERVAATVEEHPYAPLRRPLWWGAVALNGLGAALHAVALAFGPLSLVQPLGALAIVFALPLTALTVSKQVTVTAWCGAIMASMGLAGLLALTDSGSSEQSLSGSENLAVGLVAGGVVFALVGAALASHQHPALRAVLLAGAAGVASGIASVFAKAVAVDLIRAGLWVHLPSVLAIAVYATAGLLLAQASYRGMGLAAPLATGTVMNSVVAATVGVTLLGESFRYGPTGAAAATGCGAIAAGGVILLTAQGASRTCNAPSRGRPRPVNSRTMPSGAGCCAPPNPPGDAPTSRVEQSEERSPLSVIEDPAS